MVSKNYEYQKRWAEANKEKRKASYREWYLRNPKVHLARNRRWRLALKNRVPKFGQDGIEQFYANCPEGYDVDHRVPLAGEIVSGLHVIWNLQYLTHSENSRKKNKFMVVA